MVSVITGFFLPELNNTHFRCDSESIATEEKQETQKILFMKQQQEQALTSPKSNVCSVPVFYYSA